MKIVFMGTPGFAAEALKAIVASEHECSAIFTQPDKPQGRGKKIQFPPVKEIALENEIPVYQPARIRDEESIRILQELNPDVIVVAAYGKILPKEILTLPKYGCINIHASILPKYRGAAPIHWAIIHGEKETGITIMQMDEGLDTGDILSVEKIEIPSEANTGMIYESLAKIGGELLIETLEKIERRELNPLKQNDEEATYAPMLSKEDELIEWNQKASDIHNKIRGMNPWPGVYTFFRNERLKIFKSKVNKEIDGEEEPGKILGCSDEGIFVDTKEGVLTLEILQPAGKKQMHAKDFINGYKVKAGEFLGK